MRFGYDGAGFAGYARQPGKRTVEGEILRGASRRGIAPAPEALRLEVASRTDRGVHARANVLAISSERAGGPLLGALNSIAPDLWFDAAAHVPDGFRVRSARRRVYRYYEPREVARLAAYRRAARWFRGPVDARSFGRELPADRARPWEIGSVEVRRSAEFVLVEVAARSFAYGMVRKIVAALREYSEGRLTAAELQGAIRGERRLTLPLAEPDRLVLWRVELGVAWTHRSDRWGRSQRERGSSERRRAAVRAAILASIGPRRTSAGPSGR